MSAATAHPFLPDPACLTLDTIAVRAGTIVFAVRTSTATANCPLCGHSAERVHSHYPRTLLDLPWQGNAVRIEMTCRKLFCDNRDCPRRIFAEPIPTVAPRYARKTGRLLDALRELTYLVGGEAAAKIAARFGLLLSPDALLYRLKHAPKEELPTPRVLGVDDFAFRKGMRYGTILVDLEKHCPIDLLPDREAATLAAWLKAHPGVEVVSRDRAAPYREGTAAGAPDALQVADRWHLIKNLGDALERLLTRNHTALRKAIALPNPTPPLPDPGPSKPTAAQQADKAARRERRLARFEQIHTLLADGHSQREISRRTGHSRNTIRKLAGCKTVPESVVRPRRRSKITPFVEHVKRRWREGHYNAARLHSEIVAQGFTGSLSAVQRLVQSWREKPWGRLRGRQPPLVLAPRQCAFLLSNPERPKVTEEQRAYLLRLTALCPALADAQTLALSFCRLVREREADKLDSWLAQARDSGIAEIAAFARNLETDRAAVEAALSLEWSNGQTEGQVNRLKFVKRSMYGRASFDLLKARVLPPPKVA